MAQKYSTISQLRKKIYKLKLKIFEVSAVKCFFLYLKFTNMYNWHKVAKKLNRKLYEQNQKAWM